MNHTNSNKKLNSLVDDYTLVDIETTGFSNISDDIIEIACLKARNNIVIDEFDMIVKLDLLDSIPKKIVNITRITNDMISHGHDIEYALRSFLEFLEDDVIVGHNITFDIGFLRNKIDKFLDCDFNIPYIDTLYLSRKKFCNLNSHKLSFLSQALNLNSKSTHRALDDCYATFELFNLCRDNSIDPIDFLAPCENNSFECNSDTITDIQDKHFCFTGTMINMSRDEAINKCISLGAESDKSVTSKTNYLVMGIQDYAVFADGKESSKTKKAKQLIKAGQDLKIIDENVFIKMTSLNLQEG